MLNDSSKTHESQAGEVSAVKPSKWWLIGLPVWALISYFGAQFLLFPVVWLLSALGITLVGVNEAMMTMVLMALTWVIAFAVVIGVPRLMHRSTSKKELGIARAPRLTDALIAPLAYIIYLPLAGLAVFLVTHLIVGFNPEQAQAVGFDGLTHQYEYVAAFVTLVIIAPLAEELLFRGYLYGKLRRAVPAWVVALVVSAVFALLHVPGENFALTQWNVALDVFILSLVLCFLREKTGAIWAGVALHMIKNGLAFYILFINPDILSMIGG